MEGALTQDRRPRPAGPCARAPSARPRQESATICSVTAALPQDGLRGTPCCPVGAAGGQERGGLRACSPETPPRPGERARSVFGPDDLGPSLLLAPFPLLPGPEVVTGDTLCSSIGAFICLEACASRVIKAPSPAS